MVRLTVLGRVLAGVDVTPAVAAWLGEWWGHASEGVDGGYEIQLVNGSPNDDWPAGEGWAERPGLKVGGGDPLWWFATPDGDGLIEVRQETATVRIRQRAERPGVPFYEGLHLLISTGLSASGLIPLHAAAARRPGEGITLFLGRSGTGKSTTLLRLSLAGWRPVMEDAGWLVPERDEICGWDSGIRLEPDSITRFGLPLPGEPAVDSDGKIFLPYPVGAAERVSSGRLERIVVLDRRADAPSGWSDVAGREWVKAGWEATGVLLHPRARALAREWIEREPLLGRTFRFNLSSDAIPLDPPIPYRRPVG